MPYSKDQIMHYRSAFKSENQEYNAKADAVPVEKALQCYPAYHCMGNKEAISRMTRLFMGSTVL